MALLQDDVGTPGDGGTLAFGANVAANSALIAVVFFPDNTSVVNSITDTRGNTWALGKRQASSGSQAVEIWYARNANAGSCTLTFDYSATVTPQVTIAEFSGFSTGIAKDQSNGASFSSQANPSPGAITTTQATSLVIVGYRVATAFAVNAWGDSFTGLTGQNRSCLAYRELTSTATLDGDVTFAANESGAAANVNVYNAAAPSGAVVPVYMTQYRQRWN